MIRIITPRTGETTVPVATLRQHARTETYDDPLLLIWRDAALAYCEHYTGRSLGAQVLELALPAFPASGCAIPLPRGPVVSLASVKYDDTAGVEQTLVGAGYVLDAYADPQVLRRAPGAAWPTELQADNATPVRIRYTAGTDPLAGAALQAVLLLVSHADKNREAVAQGAFAEVPLGVRALLDTLVDYSGRA